jgi:peptidoglycan/xylan/chitin deacetylase (PgdA/CDA1 family)
VAAGAGYAALRSGHRAVGPAPVTVTAARPQVRPSRPARVRPRTPLVLPSPLPTRSVRVPILMYHRIGPLTASLPAMTRALTVDPRSFAAQMRWLARHGYHAITQEQLFGALEHGAPLPHRPVMITFDDGYRDVLWNAAPVLARLHFAATSYVITGRISGADPSFLTWPQLHVLERLRVEVGSHTVHHVQLPSVSDATALVELTASRRALEAHLGHPVQWFSYPAGRESPHAVRLVARTGYVLAVTTQPGALQEAGAPLLLHRDEVLSTTSARGFAALVGR